MTHKITIESGALIIMLVGVSGCDSQETVSKPSHQQQSKPEFKSFNDNFRTAEDFRKLYEEARRFENQDNLDEAMNIWEKAYESASNRSDQTIALMHIDPPPVLSRL